MIYCECFIKIPLHFFSQPLKIIDIHSHNYTYYALSSWQWNFVSNNCLSNFATILFLLEKRMSIALLYVYITFIFCSQFIKYFSIFFQLEEERGTISCFHFKKTKEIHAWMMQAVSLPVSCINVLKVTSG